MPRNPAPLRPERQIRGISSGLRAGTRGITVRDGTTDVHPAFDIIFEGATVEELDDDTAKVIINGGGSGGGGNPGSGSAPISMLNNAGQDLLPGDVVVVDETADRAVTVTTTAGDTRIAGVVQEPIADGDVGLVLFNGYAPLVNAPGAIRGEYAQTSTTATEADSTAAREAGSFAVYLTGEDFPDFATDSATTTSDLAVTSLSIAMPTLNPAERILFLALWLEDSTGLAVAGGWTLIGAETGYNYYWKVAEGDDTAEATWTNGSVAVATVLLLHESVSLAVPVEDHDYDSTTAAATVGSLSSVPRFALAGVQADVTTPGDGYVVLGGGSAGVPASVTLEESETSVPSGNATTLQFDDVIPAGSLIVIYAWRRANDAVVPTVSAGWTTCFTHLPYESDKSPGVLFSKIADGSAADGGTTGNVSTFTNAHGLMGAVFAGPESATPSDDDLGTAEILTNPDSVTRTVTAPSGGVAVMVSHGRHFGANSYSAAGSSTLLEQATSNDWPVTMVYRIGSGSLANQVDSTGIGWNQSSAVAFGPGSGSVDGTLAGKYIGTASSATSPFTGASEQNDAIFAINLQAEAKPSALLYGPDLGAGAGGEPTADAHIADTTDAHDASAVSLLDSAGLFTATDVEAAIAELAAKTLGYQAHGAMGAAETFSAATGWHSGTFDDDCTFTFSGATSGIVASMVLELLEDGTGGWQPTWPGSVVWPGGSPPTHDDTAGTTTLYLFQSRDGGTTWFGFQGGAGGGATSPLTTKGDLWGYDTADARIPVGSNGYLLVADSTDAQGVVWENPETTGHWEVLMDGGSPPEPLENGSGTDWLYVWVP